MIFYYHTNFENILLVKYQPNKNIYFASRYCPASRETQWHRTRSNINTEIHDDRVVDAGDDMLPSEEDEDEDEAKKAYTRVKWIEGEEDEIKEYFKTFLDKTITPW